MKKEILYSLVIFLLISTGALLIEFFEIIPIDNTSLAIDWRGLWMGIRGGVIKYGNETGIRYPPWSLIFILPLGFFPFRVSWGLLTLATIITLIASVPRRGRMKLLVNSFLLTLSFPSLRTIVDGNLEFLVIAGICILLYGMSSKNILIVVAGGLLAATKIQETWVLLLTLPIYAIKNWPKLETIKAILLLIVVFVPSFIWYGQDWIYSVILSPYRGSVMDSSMLSTLDRFGISTPLSLVIWMVLFLVTLFLVFKNIHSLSRYKISFLISASLLLAPYAAANNFLTLYAIGVIPLLDSWPKAGTMLFVLTNIPFLFLVDRNIQFMWSAAYWMLVILISWGVFGLKIFTLEYLQIKQPRAA